MRTLAILFLGFAAFMGLRGALWTRGFHHLRTNWFRRLPGAGPRVAAEMESEARRAQRQFFMVALASLSVGCVFLVLSFFVHFD